MGGDASETAAVLSCRACGARNRVKPVARGAPRCARCKAMLPWLVEADTASFDAEATASVPVVVDLWAPWCGPCRMVAPELVKVAARNAGRLLVVKVNTDALADLGERFGIRSIPTLAVFAGGREIGRTAGARPAADIERFVETTAAETRGR